MNKAFSRKQYLSNGWYRAKRHLSRVHKAIANRRRDWFFKLALRLVRKYDKIAIETLNLEGVKKLWGRKVFDIAFGEFSLMLQWTCSKYGNTFLKSGRWEATTKPCSTCGYHIILYTYWKSQAVFRTLHGYWSVFNIYNEEQKRKMLRTGERR